MKKNILFTFLFIVSILSLKALNFTYSPANNITLSTTNISFNWNEIIRANRYKINISTSITMSPLVVSDSGINILSRNFSLLPNTYYWQVFADTGLGYNFASTIYKFSIVNPALFDSLAFWVKADDIVGPNGTIVTNWNDNSLNGYIATQGTASRRPTLLNNTLNKKPTLVFDGTDFFNCGNVDLHINREYTAFVLSKTATTSGTRPLISKGSTTNEGNVFLYVSSTNKIVQNIDLETVVGTTTISNNKYYLYSTVTNADSSNLYINKNVEFKYVPTVDLMGTNTLSFLVGSSLGTSFWLGNISEVLIYKKRLSNIDRSNIDNYLLDKYAPPINLGKDTTTCAGNQIVLSAKNDGSYISYLWNTGSTDSAIRVTSTGIYSVRVIDIFDRISFDTVIVKFDNTNYSSLFINDTIVCIGASFSVNAGPALYRYLWSTGDTTNNINITTGGTYYVSLTNCLNNTFRDTFNVTQQNLSFSLGSDTTICTGQNVIFNLPSGYSYLWSNGSVLPNITISSEGNYWCRIYDTITGCSYSDTINIIVIGLNSHFLYVPTNNSTLSEIMIFFKWNEIIGANRYKINISTSITMSPLVVSDSGINILSRNFALLPNTYYWQVYADTGLGYNFASTIYKFSIVNPALFDSLAFWVKADDIVGPNGTIVTNWNDNSLNGYIATQGTASRRPTLLNNILNKKPTLVFDGTDFFNCGNVDLHINREYTAFVLSKTATTSGTRPLISKGTSTSEGNVLLFVSSANKLVQNIDLETVTGTTTISNNKYYLYSSVTNADSSNLYINKNVEFKYVPTVDLLGTNTSSYLIGSTSTLGSFWVGNISEILIYKKRLSNIDRSNIDNYLLDKYAPPINLGKDTTTCAGNQIVLSAKNDGSYISYLWNTGSTDSAIRVTSTGIYSVRVIDIFDRISYDTVIVKFDNSSVSNLIMRDTAVCIGTPLLLSAGPSHLRYLWSNADTSNISSLNSAGTYWVRLTDCQNNILSDTFDLIEVDLSFNLGNDTSICQGKNIILNPNPTRTVSFLWNTGATTSSIDVINQDNYWCRLTDNSVGCVSFDTLVLIVDSFSVIAKLSDDTILCNGNGITLNQGFELVRDILWNNSDTTIITSVTSTGDYSFIAFDSLGCEARDTINVRIKGNAPFVDFIVSNICEGDTLKPINLSTTLPPDNISNYSWSFGDGNIDSVGSPVHYYDSTGIYTIQLFALSDSGCSNSMSHIISYSENPIARVASIIACANSNITLTDASIVPTGYTIASWSWNVNGTTATTSSINYNFPTQGKYPINLTVITSGGCTDTYNDSFEVFPAINLDFSATGNCIGDTTKFNDITGSFSIIQREWIFASGLGYAFNTPNPTFKFTAPGNYLVSYKAKNAIGCTDSIAKNITIYSLPNALFTDSIACLNSIKTFTDRSISIDDTINYWHWNIDGANYFTPIVNHIANSTSTFPASLEVSTIHGCKDSYNRNITISNPPIADFTYTPNYGVAPLLVSFTNTSIGAVSYQWYFNDSSFANSNLASPSFTYLENKDYFPVLVATNTDGCQDSASKYISIKPSELDIQLENMELYKTLTPSGFTETRVGVRLVNVGSRTINNIKLASRIENGNIIVEDWTGSLAPGQSQFYIYNAAFYINSNDINRYICVEAYDVNDGSETNLSNNKVCKNNNSQGVTSDIYPNPSNQSANIDVVLVQATDVNITIYNELGAVIIPTTKYDGAEGLNHYSFNTNNLANGHYYMMLKYFTSEEKRKFQISR